MSDYQDFRHPFLLIMIILAVFACILGLTYCYHIVAGDELICDNDFIETRCYKVGCSGFGCSSTTVDCESNNVDRKKDIYQEVCRWEKSNDVNVGVNE